MIGLAILGFLILWLVVVGLIAAAIFRRLPVTPWRLPAVIISYLVVVPMPVTDEIIGAIQFKQACNKHPDIHVERAKAAGRTVYLADIPEEDIHPAAVPIQIQHWRFVDATSAETIISWDQLSARSGWLGRSISDGYFPMIFKGSCRPRSAVNPKALLDDLAVQQIQRKDIGIAK